jgi:hypothetical protein
MPAPTLYCRDCGTNIYIHPLTHYATAHRDHYTAED